MENRLLTLVKRQRLLSLLACKGRSQDELAVELDRSKRTISRYLRELEQVGVVRRRGSRANVTTLGRWYTNALDTLFQFSGSVHPLIERGELSPDATPPYWVLSACDPISSPPQTPYSAMTELRQRLADAESIRVVAVTLTPSLTDILSWEKTDVVLSAELENHLYDEFDGSDTNWTTVSGIETEVNLLMAETSDGCLTAFTFVASDGSHTVLVTDDVDVSCWASGYIDRRVTQA